MPETTPSPSSSLAEKRIRVILRLIGIGGMLAAPMMLMPLEWMQQMHRLVLPGELPASATVNYLTRSLAMFYALSGLVTLYISFDVMRYAPLIKLWGFVRSSKGLLLLQSTCTLAIHSGG